MKDHNTPLMSPGLVTGKIQAPASPAAPAPAPVSNGYRYENGNETSFESTKDFYNSSSLLRYIGLKTIDFWRKIFPL